MADRQPSPLFCTTVPPPGPGVCAVCRAGAPGSSELCTTCRRVAATLGRPLDPVHPISLAPDGGGISTLLARYKAPVPAPLRDLRARVLAGLVREFLVRHGSCVAPEGWDAVCTVPSLRARPAPHPLVTVAGNPVHPARSRACTDTPADTRTEAPPPRRVDLRPEDAGSPVASRGERVGFSCPARDAAGARVLLVDDVYTTGLHVQSAIACLLGAGARSVVTVVIGRRISRTWADNGAILQWAADPSHRWSPAHCHCCRPR